MQWRKNEGIPSSQVTIPPETLQHKPFIFGDFLDMNAPAATRVYRSLPGHNVLATLLEEYYMRIRY